MLVEKVMLPEKINMPGWIIVIIVIGVILGTVF